MNTEAQGALEYLVIVAAVLSISAVVVVFVTGGLGAQKEQASLSECRKAASNCRAKLATATDPNCPECESVCIDSSGEPIGTNAVKLCKDGKPTDIVLPKGEGDTPPSSDFTYSTSNLAVDTDASGSSDPDGNITSYEWDWTTDGTYEDTGETASHTYGSEGNYSVTLKITDNDGATDSTTKDVEVTEGNSAPYVENGSEEPSDGATEISTSPMLNVTVADPDGDSMDVSFYNASDDSLIGEDTGVPNGSTASTSALSLDDGTTYDWFVNVTDGSTTTTSSTWNFTTVVQYDLTVGSTSGGSVTNPGEGTFTYNEPTDVTLNASADTGYYFTNWTGDKSTIDNTSSPNTNITVNESYSITANFGNYEVVQFPVDGNAWGYIGWGDCSDQTGSLEDIDQFCKCKGYSGALAKSEDPCYHAEDKNNRYKWVPDNSSDCIEVGENKYSGTALTKVKCLTQ